MNFANVLKQHPLVVLAICGVAIRLILAATLTRIYDVSSWGFIIEDLRAGEGLYDVDQYFYTPVWGYFLEIMRWVIDLLPGMEVLVLDPSTIAPIPDVTFALDDIRVPTLIFAFVIKLPLILVDVVVSYLLYILVKEITADEKKAIFSFGAWVFIAPAILVSSVSGMFDNFAVMMLLISIFFLRKKSYCISGMALMIGIMAKIFPVLAMFPMLVYILCTETGLKNRAVAYTQFLGSALFMAALILLPHLISGDINEVFNFLTYRLKGNSTGGLSDGGLNLLILIVGAIVGALAVPWFLSRKNQDATQILFASTSLMLALFLGYYYQQQYLIEVLPLLILTCVVYHVRISKLLIILAALFVIIALGELPTMLLPLAECTNLISITTIVNIDHYLNIDPAGAWVSHYLIPYADTAVHYVLFLIALIILVQSIPKLNAWCEEKIQEMKMKLKYKA